MRQKLSIITLGVNDPLRAKDFYIKGLGWKPSEASQGDITFFQLSGLVLALFPKEKLAEDAAVENDPCGFSGITIAHLAKSEDEVNQVLSKVKSLGAEITKPAEKAFWGGYSGYFKDLDGHLFEVAHNPFLEFDDNDNPIL